MASGDCDVDGDGDCLLKWNKNVEELKWTENLKFFPRETTAKLVTFAGKLRQEDSFVWIATFWRIVVVVEPIL